VILFVGNERICSEAKSSKEQARPVVDLVAVSMTPPQEDTLAEDRVLNERFAKEEIDTWRERCRKCPDDWHLLWTTLQYARSYRVTRGLWQDPSIYVSDAYPSWDGNLPSKSSKGPATQDTVLAPITTRRRLAIDIRRRQELQVRMLGIEEHSIDRYCFRGLRMKCARNSSRPSCNGKNFQARR